MSDDELEPVDPCTEIYISELDEESVGSYIDVSPSYTTSSEECEIDYDKYRVVTNEFPEFPESPELSEYGDIVVLRITSEEDNFSFDLPFLVSEDGQSLTVVSLQGLVEFQYIDSKTEPPRID